ncbi:pirin family protein [Inquilinus sp. CAU 1745]|uniref:pirin family protein n=1 Tax=Inquilinus sp. CAU 1745 TaxID=3140369 RepID=UPI00325AC0B7
MSWQPARDPVVEPTACPPVETVVIPRTADIGGFEVRRAVPSIQRRSVGPFVFVDEMGPALFDAGQGLDVLPHPHIGLATVTYLFDGDMIHRDSLGTVQPIRPGDVNWMTAGRGIAHSERTSPEARKGGSRLAGLQTWVALPEAFEETAPDFAHHDGADLPMIAGEGKSVRLIVGSLYGERSPVRTFSETLYAEALLSPGAVLPVPAEQEERALYVVSGSISIAGDSFPERRLLVLRPGDAIDVRAEAETRLLIFGGEPLDGPRRLWWNFVARDKDRIEQAKEDWREGRFGAVPEETEALPLPGR